MDSRTGEANNQYGLRNCKHINANGGLSINKHGSNNGDEDKKEEDEVNCPHQRWRVDKANNKNHGDGRAKRDRF